MTSEPVNIELLYLDITTCARCRGARAALTQAIEGVRPALELLGRRIELTETHVATVEQARALGVIASPTIRIDGLDVQPEAHQNACADCGDLCVCAGDVDCRIWAWDGQMTTEPPVAMLVAALLRAAQGERPVGRTEPATAEAGRANLDRFFAGAEPTAPCRPPSCCG